MRKSGNQAVAGTARLAKGFAVRDGLDGLVTRIPFDCTPRTSGSRPEAGVALDVLVPAGSWMF